MVPLDIDLRQVEKSNPDICYKSSRERKSRKMKTNKIELEVYIAPHKD